MTNYNQYANNYEISLSDALEVVPIFTGDNISLDEFIEGCKEAQDMLPAGAEANLTKLIKTKVKGEARKCFLGNSYDTINDLIDSLKRVYSFNKSIYQLQGELGTIYQWKDEKVISYATRVEEIGNKILDVHKRNNNRVESANFKTTLEGDIKECFLQGLKTEINLRLKDQQNFSLAVNNAIEIERKLETIAALRYERNSFQDKIYISREEIICQICGRNGHTAPICTQLGQSSQNQNNFQSKINWQPGNYYNPQENFENVDNINTYPELKKCRYCKKIGHIINECQRRIYNNSNRQRTQKEPQQYSLNQGNDTHVEYDQDDWKRRESKALEPNAIEENYNEITKVENVKYESTPNINDKQLNAVRSYTETCTEVSPEEIIHSFIYSNETNGSINTFKESHSRVTQSTTELLNYNFDIVYNDKDTGKHENDILSRNPIDMNKDANVAIVSKGTEENIRNSMKSTNHEQSASYTKYTKPKESTKSKGTTKLLKPRPLEKKTTKESMKTTETTTSKVFLMPFRNEDDAQITFKDSSTDYEFESTEASYFSSNEDTSIEKTNSDDDSESQVINSTKLISIDKRATNQQAEINITMTRKQGKDKNDMRNKSMYKDILDNEEDKRNEDKENMEDKEDKTERKRKLKNQPSTSKTPLSTRKRRCPRKDNNNKTKVMKKKHTRRKNKNIGNRNEENDMTDSDLEFRKNNSLNENDSIGYFSDESEILGEENFQEDEEKYMKFKYTVKSTNTSKLTNPTTSSKFANTKQSRSYFKSTTPTKLTKSTKSRKSAKATKSTNAMKSTNHMKSVMSTSSTNFVHFLVSYLQTRVDRSNTNGEPEPPVAIQSETNVNGEPESLVAIQSKANTNGDPEPPVAMNLIQTYRKKHSSIYTPKMNSEMTVTQTRNQNGNENIATDTRNPRQIYNEENVESTNEHRRKRKKVEGIIQPPFESEFSFNNQGRLRKEANQNTRLLRRNNLPTKLPNNNKKLSMLKIYSQILNLGTNQIDVKIRPPPEPPPFKNFVW